MSPKVMQFKLPPSFFTKVLADYRDWRFAWIREVLQNSIDAKSTKIIITAIATNDEFTQFIISDNGTGMSRDTLENGFMSLGGSIKEDEDALGGFGVASMMIAQSHESYFIKSSDYLCTGSKGVYVINDSEPTHRGCQISVTMRNKDICSWGSPIDYMKKQLELWTSFSNVNNVKIEYNEQDLSPKCKTFEYKINTELGVLSFSDDTDEYSSQSTLYVRLKGQPMFPIKIYGNDNSHFTGVLDLIGESQENLTSNRDGLSGDKSSVISNIIKQLSSERSKYKLGNMNNFTLNSLDVASLLDSLNHEEEPSSAVLDVIFNDKNTAKADTPSHIASVFDKEKETFETLKDRVAEKIEKIQSTYYPLNFNIKYDLKGDKSNLQTLSFLIKNLNQKKLQKLAWNWRFHINSMIDCLIERHNYYFKKVGDVYFYDNKPINVGFVFNDSAEGLCCNNENEINILINPILSKDLDLESIQDIALHEATHIQNPHHGDTFSSEEIDLRRSWRNIKNISQFKRDLKFFTDNNMEA